MVTSAKLNKSRRQHLVISIVLPSSIYNYEFEYFDKNIWFLEKINKIDNEHQFTFIVLELYIANVNSRAIGLKMDFKKKCYDKKTNIFI